jgi:hypothetical protein
MGGLLTSAIDFGLEVAAPATEPVLERAFRDAERARGLEHGEAGEVTQDHDVGELFGQRRDRAAEQVDIVVDRGARALVCFVEDFVAIARELAVVAEDVLRDPEQPRCREAGGVKASTASNAMRFMTSNWSE